MSPCLVLSGRVKVRSGWDLASSPPKCFSLAYCRASPAPASWADQGAVLGSIEEDSAPSACNHNPLSEPSPREVGNGSNGIPSSPKWFSHHPPARLNVVHSENSVVRCAHSPRHGVKTHIEYQSGEPAKILSLLPGSVGPVIRTQEVVRRHSVSSMSD